MAKHRACSGQLQAGLREVSACAGAPSPRTTTRGLTTETHSLTVLKASRPRSRLPAQSPWLVDGRVLTVSSHSLSLMCLWRERSAVFPSCKDTSAIESDPTLRTPLSLHYLLIGLNSKYSHTGGCRAPPYALGGGGRDTTQSTAGSLPHVSVYSMEKLSRGLPHC